MFNLALHWVTKKQRDVLCASLYFLSTLRGNRRKLQNMRGLLLKKVQFDRLALQVEFPLMGHQKTKETHYVRLFLLVVANSAALCCTDHSDL